MSDRRWHHLAACGVAHRHIADSVLGRSPGFAAPARHPSEGTLLYADRGIEARPPRPQARSLEAGPRRPCRPWVRGLGLGGRSGGSLVDRRRSRRIVVWRRYAPIGVARTGRIGKAEAQPEPHNASVRDWTAARTELPSILVALLATRIGLLAVGVASLALMTRGNPIFDYVPDMPWLSMWARWDAEYYVSIAVDGYSFDPSRYSNISFFPLYPLLVRLGTLALGRTDPQTVALVGVVVSNLALLIALLYLAVLVGRDFGVGVARRAVLYVLVFPTTFFLSAVYAESLFLATVIATIYHARRGEWYRAGVVGCLAALTRPFGILLLIPMALEMLQQRPALRFLPSLALIPAGTAAFFGYLWWRFGDPLLYLKGNSAWGRDVAAPWDTLSSFIRGPIVFFGWPHSVLDFTFLVGLAVLAVLAWRRLPRSYAAFATAALLFSASTDLWVSTPRHALALFPVIILLAVWGERRQFHWGWLAVSIVVAVALMARFASGHWVA